jgi:hypothetical protein
VRLDDGSMLRVGASSVSGQKKDVLLTCSFRGMHVKEKLRGQGLGKVMFAVWLHVCMRLNMIPVAKQMDKPVLALVLREFGFEPAKEGSGLELKIISRPHATCTAGTASTAGTAGTAGTTVVWCSNMTKFRSIFSYSFLKTQQLEVVSEEPSPGHAQTVVVNAAFHVPLANRQLSLTTCQRVLGDGLQLFQPGHTRLKACTGLYDLLAAIDPELPALWWAHPNPHDLRVRAHHGAGQTDEHYEHVQHEADLHVLKQGHAGRLEPEHNSDNGFVYALKLHT